MSAILREVVSMVRKELRESGLRYLIRALCQRAPRDQSQVHRNQSKRNNKV